MVHPAAKKRGADPQVPARSKAQTPRDAAERKLEQRLEENMAGSDPVSVAQPGRTKPNRENDNDRK
jgi:hypothetical protein